MLIKLKLLAASSSMALLTIGAWAQRPMLNENGTNQAPEVTMACLSGEYVGQDRVVRGLVKTGTNEFMFVVPDGVRLETAGDGKLLLVSRDMTWFVSLSMVKPGSDQTELQQVLRERIVRDVPGASRLDEISATVADRKAVGFQLQQHPPGMSVRQKSILWVPFKAGVIEFSLDSDIKSAPQSQLAWDTILLTFRTNERGMIEIVRRSDRT